MKIANLDNFLTVAEIKAYLRIDQDLDDTFLADLIKVAQEQADNFLQNEFQEQNESGEWVDIPVPFSIKLACLKMIASWYETKSDDTSGVNAGGVTLQLGEIPWDAKRLMRPYRKLVGL
jgi:uncharacterized phage protein (predicted DNA packaging)